MVRLKNFDHRLKSCYHHVNGLKFDLWWPEGLTARTTRTSQNNECFPFNRKELTNKEANNGAKSEIFGGKSNETEILRKTFSGIATLCCVTEIWPINRKKREHSSTEIKRNWTIADSFSLNTRAGEQITRSAIDRASFPSARSLACPSELVS